MKFNVTVDIDWLEEGASIDDEIKQMIVNKIVSGVMVDITKEIQDIKLEAGKTAQKKIADWVDDFITQSIDSVKILVPKGRYSSDGFKEMTLREIADQEIQTALGQSIDEQGRVTTSSYDRKGTRAEVLTGDIVRKIVDDKIKERMKDITGQLNDYFSTAMENELMKQLTGAIVANIDLNSIFKKQS